MHLNKLVNIFSIVKEGYKTKKAMIVVKNVGSKNRAILDSLAKMGIVQGFEFRNNVLIMRLKSAKPLAPQGFDIQVRQVQSFKHSSWLASGLRKWHRRSGLSSHLSIISCDKGVVSTHDAASRRVGGKMVCLIR